MGDYYHDFMEALLASGVPQDVDNWIRLFQTQNQYGSARTDDYYEPWVSYTEATSAVSYNKTMVERELTFKILSAGTIVFDRADEYTIPLTISYSKDSGSTWTTITSTIGGASINVEAGDEVMFKGDNAAYCNIDEGDYCINGFNGSTAKFEVCGNIMSLVDSTGFLTADTLYSANTFTGLFMGCDGIISAENLILPATTLADYCYYEMFSNCTSLTTAPKLPATTLTSNCYNSMFHGCNNLTTAPELPATTLAINCYLGMFSNCTSLTTAPVLPATTLAERCYQSMFNGCTGLTTAPSLLATALADYCYNNMFQGCTSLTTAPALPATTLASSCYDSMFQGCTSLTQAPELPATTLAESCYQYMFGGCTNLATAPELPATTLANACYDTMFYGCTSLTAAPELPATTLARSCYSYMFYNCASLTTAPELPATTLANYCYQQMFRGCTNLNYIKCLATDISASNCTTNWVYGVASTGTFVKHPDMSNWATGNNGIPTNWIVKNDRDTLTKMPLTFEITSGGDVSWLFINNSGNGSAKTLEYKVNNGSWAEITSTTGGEKFNVSSGDTVQFRGDNTTISYSSTTMQYRNEFSGTTARFNVKGNVMSLLDKNDFANKTTFDNGSQYTFFLLFNYCTGLPSAKNLILPATALTENCYRAMFQ